VFSSSVNGTKGHAMPSDRPVICLDFDGVIHSYERGWQNGELYGTVTPGFLDWAHKAGKHFRLVVYSSRSKDPDSIKEMAVWIGGHAFQEGWQITDFPSEASPFLRLLHARRADLILLEFTNQKPPAFLTIDDRAIRFEGRWDWLDPEQLREFKTWTEKRP
jgi:hypothetical protein